MTSSQLSQWNAELRALPPLEITRWAIAQSQGRAVVSTNFRPYEAVLLHLATQVQPDIPVLWIDHGFNRPATYRHAEQLRLLLNLNLHPYHPRKSAAHYEALYGPPPKPDDEKGLQRFSAEMKLEPFRRGMTALAPTVWITALRKAQNPNRAELDIVSIDPHFNILKVNPLFYHTGKELEEYCAQHQLPNEWDYFDPAKADEQRECGLHAAWGASTLNSPPASAL